MWSSEPAFSRIAKTLNGAQRPPSIAVVVISSGDIKHLRDCLLTLGSCCTGAGAELIVVRAGSADDLLPIINQASATCITTAPGTDIGGLRRIGFERTTSSIIAFVEDQAVERRLWIAELCQRWPVWIGGSGRLLSCGPMRSAPYPALSVVIPVHNGATTLLSTLDALSLTDLPRESWEVVVVDDASTDETPLIAALYADKVVRLPEHRHGPGYARNRGFELTMGECVTFINADVMVQSDMLRKSAEVLMQDANIGAVFGSYDVSPMAKGLLSQYQNLVQRYYHSLVTDNSSTFSSACGTVRSSVFEQAGGYDEWHFPRRQLEDLELGQRIRSLGHCIVLHPDIRAIHLKRWTLRRMIATEIFDRAVPWMRLVERQLTRDRSAAHATHRTKNLNILLSWLGALCALLAFHERSLPLLVTGVACIAVVLANNASQLAFFARARGVVFAAASVPLDLLYYLISGIGVLFGWVARQAVGEPRPSAAAEAFTEMGVKRWPPVPVKRVVQSSSSPATGAHADDPAPDETSGATMDMRLAPQTKAAQDFRGDAPQRLQ